MAYQKHPMNTGVFYVLYIIGLLLLCLHYALCMIYIPQLQQHHRLWVSMVNYSRRLSIDWRI